MTILLANISISTIILWIALLAYVGMRLVPFVIAFRFGPQKFQRWARGQVSIKDLTTAEAKTK